MTLRQAANLKHHLPARRRFLAMKGEQFPAHHQADDFRFPASTSSAVLTCLPSRNARSTASQFAKTSGNRWRYTASSPQALQIVNDPEQNSQRRLRKDSTSVRQRSGGAAIERGSCKLRHWLLPDRSDDRRACPDRNEFPAGREFPSTLLFGSGDRRRRGNLGSEPKKMFSATERFGERFSSW